MKFKTVKKEYNLTPEAVDAVSEDVQAFLKDLKSQKKNVIETRLTVEEILLDLMDKFGSEKSFLYIKSTFLNKPYISIIFEGEPFNPLEKNSDEEFGNWASSLIRNADYTPSYSFDKGVNEITIHFSKEGVNPIFKLFGAIVAAVIVSLLRSVIPHETISFIRESILNPFYNAFLGLMATVEIPLVFLSVSCGIIGIGDSAVFGKIGRKMVLRFVGVILVMTTIAGVFFSALFTRFTGSDNGVISVKVGIDMLLDLIPKNLVEPITSGNTMQVVVMAIAISVALVILGPKAKTISRIMNEGNYVIVYITSLISKLLPFFIFVVLLNMIWSDDINVFFNMWKPIAAFVAVIVFLFAANFIYIVIREKVNPRILIKKMLPTFLIGFGTASSVAANGECSESLNRYMGVNKRFVEFGQPVGGVVFMPSTAINFIVCAIYMASYYEVKVSVLWFVIAVIICTFVAVATPPVPGGAVAAYTIIFAQLGIPSDAVAIVIALDILFDFIATGFDGSFLQLELIRQADGNKMINYDILRKDKE